MQISAYIYPFSAHVLSIQCILVHTHIYLLNYFDVFHIVKCIQICNYVFVYMTIYDACLGFI